ncbi:hypothetical protein [Streptomyces chilikensis]|uniref:hypothetical protein n=1 Tax=Streptomyces chilikensis TaxID=1194079 RepID=UPI000A4AB079|nr:hypothetical protein [Streptomyces chilikensis]
MNRTAQPGRVLLAGTTALAAVLLGAPNAQAAESDISFSEIVFNGGRPIVVGITNPVDLPLTYTVRSTVELSDWNVNAYRGTLGAENERVLVASSTRWSCATTTASGYTYRRCDETVTVDPRWIRTGGGLVNGDATEWKTWGLGHKAAGGHDSDTNSATVILQRASRIQDHNASPEPVAKGGTITVKGTVQRANWTAHRYDNYGGRLVSLQFKPAGSSTYTTVKKVTASSGGALKTTVTATQDGTWRWKYYGNTTTGASSSSGDYVDVQ